MMLKMQKKLLMIQHNLNIKLEDELLGQDLVELDLNQDPLLEQEIIS